MSADNLQHPKTQSVCELYGHKIQASSLLSYFVKHCQNACGLQLKNRLFYIIPNLQKHILQRVLLTFCVL